MAVSYVVAAIGMVFQLIDASSYVYNSDDFKNWLTSAMGSNPVLLGRIMLVIAACVAIARLRTILGVHRDEER